MNTEHRAPSDPEAFRSDLPDPLNSGVRETLLVLLGRSIGRLEDPALRPTWVVHEVRKDLKRARALLRLVADSLPTRSLEKTAAAAARKLAHLRDADAVEETVSRLRLRADARELEAIEALADELAREREIGLHALGLPRYTAIRAANMLRGLRAEVEALSFEGLDPAALEAGLEVSRRTSAAAFRRVVADPVMPRFHDLRKAVKRELYQRELSGRSLDQMGRATLKKLAEVLGELQDLDVLREALRRMARWRGPVRQLVARTIRELKARALRLGAGRYPEEALKGRPRGACSASA
jgi:CHAD domain-containing protein